MPRTAKPAAGTPFPASNPLNWGPWYGFTAGSGTSVPDLSPTAAPALALSGATWASGPFGPELSIAGGATATAADAPGLRRPTNAITAVVGYTRVGTLAGELVFAKLINGYDTWALFSGTTKPFTARALAATALTTPYDGETLATEGLGYVVALRWQAGAGVNVRAYRRDTGALVSDVTTGSTMAGPLAYAAFPLQIGPAPGLYDFAAISPDRLSDAQLNAFAADPWAGWTATAPAYRPRPRALSLSLPGVGL